jgi:hypothetical protein
VDSEVVSSSKRFFRRFTMGKEVGSDDGLGYVRYYEAPREVPPQSQVEAEGQPSISGDGRAVGRAEIIVDS